MAYALLIRVVSERSLQLWQGLTAPAVFCADYLSKHKKKVTLQRNFRSVRDIGFNSLKKILPRETSGEVKETDYLCQHCFLYIKAEIQSAPESSYSGGDAFIRESEAIDKLNRYVLPTKVSPLKPQSQVASRCRESYGKRKQAEIEEAVVSDVRTRIQTAYGTSDVSGPSQDKCNTCSEWMTNFRLAYAACASHQERCRLLTLLPPSLTRKEIESAVPEATRYLINKSRKLRDDHGVWSIPDPYSRCKVSEEELSVALEYFTKDELGCSRQSPNQRDVIFALLNDKKQYMSKSFMTRSIRESFRVFKNAHAETKIGLTKFHSLRPRWVKCAPQREVCVCIDCAKFKLCVAALENVSDRDLNVSDLELLYICSPPTNQCRLGDCARCPKDRHFTLDRLGIPEEAEILVAAWESGNLIKKSLDSMTFMNELQTLVGRWIPHNQIRSIPGKAIYTEKRCEEKGSLVLHFDFAENGTVVLPDEVQAYHWHKKQVSVFTCVATTRKSTRSFAVISDDVCHDSAHACCAIGKITDWLDDNAPVHSQVTFVSDGAASHFKNKYQLHKFRKLEYPAAKWLLSATGHGKNACDGVGGLVKHHSRQAWQSKMDKTCQEYCLNISKGSSCSTWMKLNL